MLRVKSAGVRSREEDKEARRNLTCVEGEVCKCEVKRRGQEGQEEPHLC